jgi:hypothetical protein
LPPFRELPLKILGLNPEAIDYLNLAEKVFGGYDKNSLNNILMSFSIYTVPDQLSTMIEH